MHLSNKPNLIRLESAKGIERGCRRQIWATHKIRSLLEILAIRIACNNVTLIDVFNFESFTSMVTVSLILFHIPKF